ncbi:Elicitin-like protein [Globisporangium polare]
MKFFLALAALALAVANAADCDLTKVAPLLTDVDVKQCSSDTGFSPPTPPTAAILPKLCGNTACQAALAKLKALNLGDCVVLGTKLETDLINPIEAYCHPTTPAVTPAPATGTPTTGTPTTGTPTTGTPTTGTPSTTPAPATKKPVC